MTRNRFMRVPKRIQVCLKKTPARPGYTENWLPVVVAVFPGPPGFWTKLYVPSSCTCDVCDLICPPAKYGGALARPRLA